ncbi:MAG TPA: DUF177 domain-containing protein [Vicinamibacterales bacterium]|nr:DUF177 domain-containing protein [Vicinamibacterales bacterium]
MLLDLRGFRSGTDEVVRQFPPDAFELKGEDFRIVAPVQLTAKITKDNEKVRLVGRLETTLETDCGRCLDPFPIPVDAGLDLLFLPEADQMKTAAGDDEEDEAEVREADTGVSFYKNDTIDLGEMMRDEFYLALPMKPLCQADCKGLCPVCGRNRNRESCDCKAEWVDPRMEPLKRLLDR